MDEKSVETACRPEMSRSGFVRCAEHGRAMVGCIAAGVFTAPPLGDDPEFDRVWADVWEKVESAGNPEGLDEGPSRSLAYVNITAARHLR
jgi:hypothetical protein